MNGLETNLSLWAICSIILFEILILICLFRCCFNRIRPKKFYLKREEYEYLQGINNNKPTKFSSIILRPPHADELALVGTIRRPNPIITYNKGIQNLGFYSYDEDKKIPQISTSSSSSSSQHWLNLQSQTINTAQLPPADYEIHSYPIDNYSYRYSPLPRPIITDFRQYHEDYVVVDDDDDDDHHQLENYRFQSLRRPEIIPSQVHRIDTSTEFYGINYSNIVPKSILKSTVSLTPPNDFLPTQHLQIQDSSTSSNSDESLQNSIEKRISFETILPSTAPMLSNFQMRFASIKQLNDIAWEIPREFQTITHESEKFHSNHERTPFSSIIDSTISISQRHEMNRLHTHYLSKSEITQQQAFEY